MKEKESTTTKNKSKSRTKKDTKFTLHEAIPAPNLLEVPESPQEGTRGNLGLGTLVKVTSPRHGYKGCTGTIVQVLTLLPGCQDRKTPVTGYRVSFQVSGSPLLAQQFFLMPADFEVIAERL